MATEVEQLYLQLELINIEEKMLKLQMLKRRRQRRRLRGSVGPAEAERVNLQHWLNKCTLDNLECQRASSPYTAVKTGKGNCWK